MCRKTNKVFKQPTVSVTEGSVLSHRPTSERKEKKSPPTCLWSKSMTPTQYTLAPNPLALSAWEAQHKVLSQVLPFRVYGFRKEVKRSCDWFVLLQFIYITYAYLMLKLAISQNILSGFRVIKVWLLLSSDCVSSCNMIQKSTHRPLKLLLVLQFSKTAEWFEKYVHVSVCFLK